MPMSILLELAGIFLLIEKVIWDFNGKAFYVAIPVLLAFLSWLLRDDNLETLGLKPADFTKDADLILALTGCLAILILWISFVWNPNFPTQKEVWRKALKHIPMYYPWALLQNLWLNGYFVNRLTKVFSERPKLVSVAVGILFAIVHWPNPVLVIATLIGGGMSVYFFQRNRNLYWLALSHAILAVSLLYFLPDSWHHHLRIGPDYWTWKL